MDINKRKKSKAGPRILGIILTAAGIALLTLFVRGLYKSLIGESIQPSFILFGCSIAAILFGVILINWSFIREPQDCDNTKSETKDTNFDNKKLQSDTSIKKCMCGTENQGGAAFCKSCGARFDKTCPACSSEVAQDASFCTNCGKLIQ